LNGEIVARYQSLTNSVNFSVVLLFGKVAKGVEKRSGELSSDDL
jgi:hypothetical protein